MFLQCARHTANRAARTYSRYKYVHLPVRIPPDLLTRSKLVRLGVGRVLELLQNHSTGYTVTQLLCLGNRACHARHAIRQHDFRSEGFQQITTFNTHCLRHGQHQMIALDSRYHCQPYSGVATGRLYYSGAGLQRPRASASSIIASPTRSLHCLPGLKDSSLATISCCSPYFRLYPARLHQRSTADEFRQVLRYFRHNSSEFIQNKNK